MGKIGNRKSILYATETLPGDTEVLVDSSGRLVINAALIAGIAAQFDDTDKLAVSIYGKASAAGDKPVLVSAAGEVAVAAKTLSPVIIDGDSNSPNVATNINSQELFNVSYLCLFNGVTWDRNRNNASLTLLASAARTALANSPDQVNFNAKGVYIYVDVTARSGTTTLTPKITGKDPIGGDYLDIWSAAAAINTANGSFMYTIYPVGAADAAYLTTENVIGVIPRDWRLTVTPSDGDSVTYSAALVYVL